MVFLDREYGFRVEPDIIADNTQLPFRENIFSCIIFDPPWGINLPPWFTDKDRANGTRGSFFGDFKSKRELITYIHKAQREFQKYTNRLCFKWGERNVSLWNILPLFTKDGWEEIYRVKINSPRNKGGKSKNQTWWVTLTLGGILPT